VMPAEGAPVMRITPVEADEFVVNKLADENHAELRHSSGATVVVSACELAKPEWLWDGK
jgi:hypothetical protein